MSIKELILAVLLAATLPAQAAPVVDELDVTAETTDSVLADEAGQTAEELIASLNYQTGKVVLGDQLATLDLPPSLVFLSGEDAERVLVDIWGNPPDNQPPLGMILPVAVSPLASESWAVTVEYEANGYVSDKDAADIDYKEMLQDLQKETQENNAWRAENGYEPVLLVGWAATPRYDAQGKKLHWAKELKFGDSDEVLNYNIRVLGRKGVLVLNFVAGMDQLAEIEQQVPVVLAMTEFNQGHRYAEFDPDIDDVAAYGIGALIAGKLAAKTGLLAAALLLLKKFWIIPVLAFGWIYRRITGVRKVKTQALPAAAPDEPVAVAPVSSVLDMNKPGADSEKP
ncbi:MAG: DUF2167 domain-containing protein [Pseudomonas sp.]|uniref:DUF2167 domain-containing protein n=1 Tax=Pseudomonas sp. TaxID=306 RepID=UPI00271F7C1C|nr:DUF2167 domain-containing protein [Pseudomonas sp.]MDO9617180.1 DUF2167 domain-containing protein [Pseudomonas sp.]MDP2444762.1 DUF2167 domain-containing protein [Pseudomonas sp.]MDZ4336779.1 DUF2167 domain-containing protein [Pseudomonas sp.]